VSDEAFRFEADTPLLAALEADDRVLEAFRRLGLKCVDRRNEPCPAVAVETLADAASFHEIPLDRILEELRRLGVVARKPPCPDPANPSAS
jgi:hypothetical protein